MNLIPEKAKRVVRLAFSRPFDQSTAEGRSRERYRRAALTTLAMASARVSNALTAVLLVPMTLDYLGDDLFGVWMAITTFVTCLAVYDLGIGVGLRNLIIKSVGEGDEKAAPLLVANALVILCALAILLVAIAVFVVPLAPWETLIKCKDPASVPEILPTMQACLIVFAIGLPITQLQNIANGFQRGYWGYVCFLVGRLLGFLFVVLCVSARWPLWAIAGGYIGFPFLVMAIGWIAFLVACPALRPWPLRIDPPTAKRLFGVGGFVLLLNLSLALTQSFAVILIANTIDAASAVPYSVTTRLLAVTTIVTYPLMNALSPAVGEAWHKGDYSWVKNNVRRTLAVMCYVCVLPHLAVLFFGRPIIAIWTQNEEAVPGLLLLIACVAASALHSLGSLYKDYLIAMNYVRFAGVAAILAAVLFLAAGYVAGRRLQSPEAIVFSQVFLGIMLPSVCYWARFRSLLKGRLASPQCG